MKGFSFHLLSILLAFSLFGPVRGSVAQGRESFAVDPAKVPEKGVHYGKAVDLTLPKTILFSIGPEDLARDAKAWVEQGVQAFFLDFIAREWSSDIWARDGKPWTIGPSDETFQKALKANQVCHELGCETFLKIAFDHPFEWFNDIAWQRINNNFRQFAIFARETGCTGIALDIEYVGEQYTFNWKGYDYRGYTRKDLVEKIRQRMTRVIQVLYDEFPDMVLVTFPEEGFSLGTVIHTAWIEEAARRDAPGGVHYCLESTYRRPNIRYVFGHVWAANELFHKVLSDRARAYWEKRCSIAPGIWPFGKDYSSEHAPGMSLEAFRQGYAATLMAGRRYNWIYSHNSREQLLGRNLDVYKGQPGLGAYVEVIRRREIVTDPKWIKLAKQLRDLRERDYSQELGLRPVPVLRGPEDTPQLQLAEARSYDPSALSAMWRFALDYLQGNVEDVQKLFGTVTHWLVAGPYPNKVDFQGLKTTYPPERALLQGSLDKGLGDVPWVEVKPVHGHASVDLTRVLQPTEHVCAYALCWITSPVKQKAQIRLGTNDAGKMWLGRKLVYEYPREGSAILDRDIVDVELPAGTTPVLLKVCNGVHNWGFVFRVTDRQGRVLRDLQFSVKPPTQGAKGK